MRFEELLELMRRAYADADYPAALADDALRIRWANAPAKQLLFPADIAGRPEPFSASQKDVILSSLRKGTPFAIRSVTEEAGLTFYPILADNRLVGSQILSGKAGMLPGSPNPQEIRQFVNACEKSSRLPLTIIFSTLGLLSREIHDSATLHKYLDLIRQNCYRLLRSSNNMASAMGFCFGILHPDLQNGDIAAFVRKLCANAAVLTDKIHIPLTCTVPETSLRTAFDPIWVRRMLLNLISNSCKSTRAGNAIAVRVEAQGKQVAVTVSDKGAGISPRILEQLRSPKQIIKINPYLIPGSGLGLTLVQRMATLQSGRLEIRSTEGVGTEVTFRLPLQRDNRAPEYLAQDDAQYLRDHFSDLYVELSDVYVAPPL